MIIAWKGRGHPESPEANGQMLRDPSFSPLISWLPFIFQNMIFPFYQRQIFLIYYILIYKILSLLFFSSFPPSFPSRSTPFCLPMDNGLLLAYFWHHSLVCVSFYFYFFINVCTDTEISLSLIYSSEEVCKISELKIFDFALYPKYKFLTLVDLSLLFKEALLISPLHFLPICYHVITALLLNFCLKTRDTFSSNLFHIFQNMYMNNEYVESS